MVFALHSHSGRVGVQQAAAGARGGADCAGAVPSVRARQHQHQRHAGLAPSSSSTSHQQQQRPSVLAAAAPAPMPTAATVGQSHYMRDPAPWPTAAELTLPAHDLATSPYVDLIVCGAGPSGVAVAERVAQAGFSVVVVDPQPLGVWPNNYGVWVDEFVAMGLEDCLEVVWPKAKVWLTSGTSGEK